VKALGRFWNFHLGLLSKEQVGFLTVLSLPNVLTFDITGDTLISRRF